MNVYLFSECCRLVLEVIFLIVDVPLPRQSRRGGVVHQTLGNNYNKAATGDGVVVRQMWISLQSWHEGQLHIRKLNGESTEITKWELKMRLK